MQLPKYTTTSEMMPRKREGVRIRSRMSNFIELFYMKVSTHAYPKADAGLPNTRLQKRSQMANSDF